MTQQTSIAKTEQLSSPLAMIQAAFEKAIEQGAAMEVVGVILQEQNRMIERQDSTAFQAALRRIQDDLKPITKDSTNPETHSKYASARKVDEAIERLMAREQMTLSFEPEPHPNPDMLRIVGVLSLGAYSKRYPLDIPADGKGAKGGGVMSRTHAMGSAITYGKRYLKGMIFNLRFQDKDDDGNAAAGLSVEVYAPLMEAIENAQNATEVTKAYIVAIKTAGVLGDRDSILAFEKAANKRKQELAK